MSDARSAATRSTLVRATMQVIREQGISAVSARSVATAGGVNQALVFYHFGSVEGLVAQACRESTAERVALLAPQLEAVASFGDLVELAGRLHDQEREAGNVTVLAQVLAASHANPSLAAAAGESLELWTEQVRATLRRLLVGSPVAEVLDADALTDLVSATFVGLELMEPTRSDDRLLLDSLAGVGRLARALDDLGPVSRRALRTVLRSTR
ncbi:MAG: TetR/AcrR family transcriptional regulator [Aeromicrobium erythreum]